MNENTKKIKHKVYNYHYFNYHYCQQMFCKIIVNILLIELKSDQSFFLLIFFNKPEWEKNLN